MVLRRSEEKPTSLVGFFFAHLTGSLSPNCPKLSRYIPVCAGPGLSLPLTLLGLNVTIQLCRCPSPTRYINSVCDKRNSVHVRVGSGLASAK